MKPWVLPVGLLLVVGTVGCGEEPRPIVKPGREPEPIAEVEAAAEPEPVAEEAMQSPILLLVLGILIGVLLTAKPIRELVTELPAAAYPYILFGLMLFGATWALSWLGFTAVIAAYVLYQIVGRRSEVIGNLLTLAWLKRQATPQPGPEEAESAPRGDDVPPAGHA